MQFNVDDYGRSLCEAHEVVSLLITSMKRLQTQLYPLLTGIQMNGLL